MFLGVGLPLVFIPIMTASYHGIPPNKTDQASAIINAARNMGGSIGVALGNNVLAHREQFHQSRLAEAAIPSSATYNDALQQATHYFAQQGSSLALAQQQAFAWIGTQVQAQASLLAYADNFRLLAYLSLACLPLLVLLVRLRHGKPTA